MLWEGNRQLQEYTHHHIFTTIYDQDSFEPVSRVVQSRDKDCDDLKIYHYHNNHLGTPQELTNEQGEMVWLNYEFAWGGRYTHHYTTQSLNGYDILEHELQPIHFQGQYYDPETSLHYNRFRYYDSNVGMFIQRDLIGLLGGFNTFQYAPNPIRWVDPWGLAKVIAKMQPYRYDDVIVKNPHADIFIDNKKVTEAKLSISPEGKVYWERFGDMKSASKKEISQAQKLIDNLHNNASIMSEAKEQLKQGINDAISKIGSGLKSMLR